MTGALGDVALDDAEGDKVEGKRLGDHLEDDSGTKKQRMKGESILVPAEVADRKRIADAHSSGVEVGNQRSAPGTGSTGACVGTTDRVKNVTDDDLQVEVITNDGDPSHMVTLIALKEIFHHQLPKMPKEYIVRLVFDRKHKSLVLSRAGVPIGGITYRPFYEQKFAEIVFCAVTGTEQVKGYGSRLMNELKEHAKLEDISYFQTYADNFAIGYFAKQGFSRTINMSKDRWVGYVKDYDGGTHMECYVHPSVPYMAQAEMLRVQRDFIVDRILEQVKCSTVYRGLTCFKEGKTIDPQDIPGVLEAGWTPEEISKQTRRSNERDRVQLNKDLMTIWREVEKNENAWPFREPVDLDAVKDYLEVISTPIDLRTMRERLEILDPPFYKSKAMLKADMLLMLSNCQKYNAETTEYFKSAVALTPVIEELFGSDSSTASHR